MTGTAAADVKDPLKPDKPVRNHNLIQKQSDFPSMRFNLTCNTTLEDVTIDHEDALVGPLAFHVVALILTGGFTLIAILLSFYLMWMHALNYTKPREQRQIIRILLMVPVYSTSGFLQIYHYRHAIYFQVMSDCYEAFAIASFFTLMCHYTAPNLHQQKDYFRKMRPVKPWVWPINWFAVCCGKQRGVWRTPKSGLTWFNIIWVGIYHYCFIRVAMTVTAVVTQHYNRYCESSNSPVFAHIWILAINSLAVTVAMYCVIQFYVQLREPLAEHKPFLKVLSIKLVIFLVFWQTMAISVAVSSLDLLKASEAIAYPDIKVGIPALLLCFEMCFFALLHLWAYSWLPYKPGAKQTFYPVPDPSAPSAPAPKENAHSAPSGGPLGLFAFIDAVNVWDVVKAFGRGMRWLFCGVRRRKQDVSYENNGKECFGDGVELGKPGYNFPSAPTQKSTEHLPIATQFRRSAFGAIGAEYRDEKKRSEESAGLIANAQASPKGAFGGATGQQWASKHDGSAYSNPPHVSGANRETELEAFQEEAREDVAEENRRQEQRHQQVQNQRPGRKIAGDIRQQFPASKYTSPSLLTETGQGAVGWALWGEGGRI